MTDSVFELRKGAIVEECGLYRHITQGPRSDTVPISGVSSHLFESEVLILVWPIEDNVPLAHSIHRCNLRDSNIVLLEVAEHLVGRTRNSMAGYAVSSAKE